MRITIVIPTLHVGGAERVAVSWANHWTAIGHDVAIVTLDFANGVPDFALDERVAVRDLKNRTAAPSTQRWAGLNQLLSQCTAEGAEEIRNDFPLLLRIRDVVLGTRPEAVVGFTNVASARIAASLYGEGIAVFATEHADPRVVFPGHFAAARSDLYRLGAATVVALTQSDLDWLLEHGAARGAVIFNPTFAARRMAHTETSRTIIALGRLRTVKGFDILIDAFSRIAPDHPAWRLRICGDGLERSALTDQAARSGATIELPGMTRDPQEELARAAIFALPSRSESFPNALLEAMACGLPAVASSCSAGVREIVRHGVDGLMIEPGSAGALATALDTLIRDDVLRTRLAARAPEVTSRYSLAEASARWDALFAQCVSTAGAVSS